MRQVTGSSKCPGTRQTFQKMCIYISSQSHQSGFNTKIRQPQRSRSHAHNIGYGNFLNLPTKASSISLSMSSISLSKSFALSLGAFAGMRFGGACEDLDLLLAGLSSCVSTEGAGASSVDACGGLYAPLGVTKGSTISFQISINLLAEFPARRKHFESALASHEKSLRSRARGSPFANLNYKESRTHMQVHTY